MTLTDFLLNSRKTLSNSFQEFVLEKNAYSFYGVPFIDISSLFYEFVDSLGSDKVVNILKVVYTVYPFATFKTTSENFERLFGFSLQSVETQNYFEVVDSPKKLVILGISSQKDGLIVPLYGFELLSKPISYKTLKRFIKTMRNQSLWWVFYNRKKFVLNRKYTKYLRKRKKSKALQVLKQIESFLKHHGLEPVYDEIAEVYNLTAIASLKDHQKLPN